MVYGLSQCLFHRNTDILNRIRLFNELVNTLIDRFLNAVGLSIPAGDNGFLAGLDFKYFFIGGQAIDAGGA